MELQVKRLHVAAESLTRAAAQIKSVEEAVHKSAHAAETLPYRMQEKLAEFNEASPRKRTATTRRWSKRSPTCAPSTARS